jgi:hypothetical protein
MKTIDDLLNSIKTPILPKYPSIGSTETDLRDTELLVKKVNSLRKCIKEQDPIRRVLLHDATAIVRINDVNKIEAVKELVLYTNLTTKQAQRAIYNYNTIIDHPPFNSMKP